jgi:serine/threonine protein kinase
MRVLHRKLARLEGGDPVMDDRDLRIERLWERARSLAGPEREQFLDAECGDDATLRAGVEHKLAEETVDPRFFAALDESEVESALQALTLDYTGTQLGDFRLGRPIGKGATGIVHEAVQLSVSRTVAVKVLAPMMVSNAERLERFRREAYSQSRLRHPHVAPAFFFGSAEGIPYLAMERVNGTSLREHMARERKRLESAHARDPKPVFDPFDPRTAARLIAQVASALDHCHRKGVIHRDVKPNNILIDESFEPRIIDFGIARDQSLDTLTRANDVYGTPYYMSPEQARSRRRPVDHRTDVYSAGAVLYEMLTQQPPFPGRDSLTVLDKICNERLKAVRSLNPRVPRELELICHKAMEKDPALRYGTSAELAQDLESYLSGRTILARAPSIARRSRAFISRHPSLAASSLAVILLVGFGALLSRRGDALAADAPILRSLDATEPLQAGLPKSVYDKLSPAEKQAAYKEWIKIFISHMSHEPIPEPVDTK